MNLRKILILVGMMSLLVLAVSAQQRASFDYRVEAGALASDGGRAPLWFTANRYGVTSIDENQAFVRAGLWYRQQLKHDWKVEAGLDMTGGVNLVSDFWVHQAYADVSWKVLNLSVGSKERLGFPLEKNERLSSGWLVEGMNARPIPQVRAEIKDFLVVPGTKRWLAFKGHLAYGWFLDGDWQEGFVSPKHQLVKDILYHSKSLAIRIGNREKLPVELEIGILTTAQFGGKKYEKLEDGSLKLLQEYGHGFKDYMHILIPKQRSTLENVDGNHLGSWNFVVNVYPGEWKVKAYLEHYFEDHSQMFWQYGRWKDGLLGLDVTLPRNKWVNAVVWECMASKDQTGSILYDGVGGSFGDLQLSGCDNYYNHGTYGAWQYYGMGMGNALIPGPLYNTDGSIRFLSNRVRSHHLGVSGVPSDEWNWRVLASFVRHWGTYWDPLDRQRKQFSGLAEVAYLPRWAKGWSVSASVAMDRGNYLGNKCGGMLTLRKVGGFGL